jgi:2-polyprenyl-6-methoxyphenol hydroxylase-like FAD-dependent oxidoreductase
MATDEDCEGAVLTSPNPDAESAKWNKIGSKDHMLEAFKNFHPDVIALLNMAVPKSIKVWKLLDGPSLNTWVNGKCALLGDAAHPFLPHQGQGGAQAMEDVRNYSFHFDLILLTYFSARLLL